MLELLSVLFCGILLILSFVIEKKLILTLFKKSALIIGSAFLYNGWIFYAYGQKLALEFLGAYLIEEALSIDNLFVFFTDFSNFANSSK